MKKFIYIMTFILSFQALNAQTIIEKAEKAYTDDNYSEAIELYEQLIKEDNVSSDLYYNLACAYYKSGDIAKAVLFNERALLLNPNNKEATANLAFLQTKLVDKIGNDKNIADSIIYRIMNLFSYNGWAVFAIVSFILILVCAALYLFTDSILIRKTGFFGGMAMIVICLLANVFAYKASKAITDSGKAIIVSNSTILSLSPREPKNKSEEAFMLHEGTKVEILDSVEVNDNKTKQLWYNVKADDAHQAWIISTDVEKI